MTQTTGDSAAGPAQIESNPALLVGAGTTATSSGSGRLERLHRLVSRPGVAELLVGLAALLLFSWRVGRASPWWDEAITRDVTSRSASEIVDLVGNVDLVHAAYYLLVHALLGESAGVTPIRMISVLAATVTAVLLVRLGRELAEPSVGVLAGALFVLAPLSSRYAQEARPYAIVAMLATAATIALVRACNRSWQPGRWALYVGLLVLVGMFNVLGLLLLVVHLVYVLAVLPPRTVRRWAPAAAAVLVLVAPILIGSTRQREQVAWLPRPGWAQLTGFLGAEFAARWVVLALVVLAIVGAVRKATPTGTHVPALVLGLSWALLPPVILWTVSQVHPLYDWRYVFFTVPGAALALGSLATLLRARWLVMIVLVLALSGLHMQQVYRYLASGHAENIRGAAQLVQAHAEAGDAVLFLPSTRRVVKMAYPEAFRATDDIALDRSGEQTATLFGVETSPAEVRSELKHRSRVWLITGPERYGEAAETVETEKEHLLDAGAYELRMLSSSRGYEVRLYERVRHSKTGS